MTQGRKPKHHGFTVGLHIKELNATVLYIEAHPVRPSLDRIGLRRHCCGLEEEFNATTTKQYINGKKGKKYPKLCRRCSAQKGVAMTKRLHDQKPEAFLHGPVWPVPQGDVTSTYYEDCRIETLHFQPAGPLARTLL